MAEDTHETKIRITGDESSAVRSISAVVGGLNRVRAAVSNVMRALGVIGFAVHGVEMIVDVFRKVRDKITETERALAKVRWDSWVGGFNAQADIIIAAIGQPAFVTADMVKEGATVIDVGTTRVPDATRKSGFRLQGDVDFETVSPKCAAITPVPGGVGPMTICMLMLNTLAAGKKEYYK